MRNSMKPLAPILLAIVMIGSSASAQNLIVGPGPAPGRSGTITSLGNSDSTITLTPNPITTTGTVSLNLAHANTFTALQGINLNAGSPVLPTNQGFQVVGSDATGVSDSVVAYGASPLLRTYRADGTGASPTALGSGETIGQFAVAGYDGGTPGTFITGGSIVWSTTQAWPVGANGSQVVINAVPNGSATVAPALTLTTTAATLPGTLAVAGTINKLTLTAPATGATLSLADGSTLATSGAFATTLTFTGATNVTFPASGTLLTAAGAVTSLAGTANQITTSASTGAVTLSLPSTLIAPGTFAANSLAPTASACAGTYFNLPAANTLGGCINGVQGVTWASGGETILVNGSQSNSPLLLNGTLTTGGSGTTNFPALLIQPAGTSAVTSWSISGVGLGMNMPSGFVGAFVDFHAAGAASVFKVINTGALTISSDFIGGGNILGGTGGSQLGFTGKGVFTSTGSGVIQIGAADNTTAVAQALLAQSVAAGNGNTSGATFTIAGSKSNGSGCGGDIDLQTTLGSAASGTQNTLANALVLKGCTQQVQIPAGLAFTGSAPALSSCGTSPSVGTGSTDSSGQITEGATATGCTITFATSKTNTPFCIVTSQTTLVTFAYTLSTAAITITNTSSSGDVVNYVCTQH